MSWTLSLLYKAAEWQTERINSEKYLLSTILSWTKHYFMRSQDDELKILKIFYALKSKEKKASFSRWWKCGPLRKPSVTLWKLNNEKTIISLSQLETQAGVGTSSQTAFDIPNDLKQNEVHLTFLNLNNSLNKYIVLNQHRKCWAAAE